MRPINNGERMFLRELLAWGGVATPEELKSMGGSLARRTCKKNGLATYDGTSSNNGYWRITDSGRKAMTETPINGAHT